MEKRKIEISEHAEKELVAECQYYYEQYSEKYAEHFRKEFYEQVKTILPYPLAYSECRFLPTKRKIYRNIVWGNYLIVYRITSLRIEVLTLFHTKRNPTHIKGVRSRKAKRTN